MNFSSILNPTEFLKNVAKLATGTTFAQAISILTAPILYRIYDKEDYGTLGLYMAILGVVGVFSTMQYTQAILLEKEDDEAKKVLWLNRVINIIFTLISVLFVFLLSSFLGEWLGNPNITIWLWLLPISIFFSGQNQIYRVWANRRKKYNLLTLNSILLAIIIPVTSITIGLFKEGPLGLFSGLLLGHTIPPIILYIALSKKEKLTIKYRNNLNIIRKAKEHRKLPIYNMPAEFINRFTNQLPIFMLSTFIGSASVGVYNLCVRMLGIPVHLISSSVGEVFRQQAASDYNIKGDCRSVFKSVTKSLALLSIIPFLVLIIWGPDIFAFFFGEHWIEAGYYARIISIFYLLKFIVSPISFMFTLSGHMKEDFFLHIWMLVSSSILLYIGFSFLDSVYDGLLLFSINYAIIYLIYFYRSYSFCVKSNET